MIDSRWCVQSSNGFILGWISCDITFTPVLVDIIKKYPGCNRLVFGIKIKIEPAPNAVKKMILVLISANILCKSTTVKESTYGVVAVDDIEVVTKDVLGYSKIQGVSGIQTYAMFDDYYWQRIKLAYPLG